MGLITKQGGDNSCDVVTRDCVGKQGDCPVVVAIDECKFDRNDQVWASVADCVGKVAVPDFDDIDETMEDFYLKNKVVDEESEVIEAEEPLSENWQKDLLDDIMAVLVKYHNKL